MGSVWLTEMADWLRAAGLSVVEQDGWQSRSRSSGGFEPGRPWCVMWHHTASGTSSSAEGDANYMSYGSADRPIANLMPARNGDVWVLAAGATNTNGKGSDFRTTSRGTVPVDSMNTYAVGMEIQNSGVGEPYPQVQIDAAFKTSLTICKHLGLQPDDAISHHGYTEDRKIDPATASAVQGPWQPSSVSSSGTWSLDDLRAECRRRATQPPEDEVTQDDIDKIVDAVVKRLPSAVWKHEIDSEPDDPAKPEPAKFYLQRAFLLTRQYLGGYSKLEPPDPTVLKRIDDNVKKLLK